MGLGFGHSGGDGDDAIHLGELEELQHPRGQAGSDGLDALVVRADVVGDDHAEAEGVHVGYFGEVEDVPLRKLLARSGLEGEDLLELVRREVAVHLARGEGADKAEDDG